MNNKKKSRISPHSWLRAVTHITIPHATKELVTMQYITFYRNCKWSNAMTCGDTYFYLRWFVDEIDHRKDAVMLCECMSSWVVVQPHV